MTPNVTLPQLSARVRELTRQRALTFLSRMLMQGVIDADDYQTLWRDFLRFKRGERTSIKKEAETYDDEQVAQGNVDAKRPPYHYLKPRAFAKKMLDLESSGKITADIRVRYYQLYEEYHKQLKANVTHKTQARYHWREIRSDLNDEIASVRTGIIYYRRASERNANLEERKRFVAHQRAYERYLAVLVKTSTLIRNAIRAGTTPLQLVDLMAEQDKHVPNRGQHWVDWVAPATKRAIIIEFNALPHTLHAKRRHPFQRTETVQATITRPRLATELPEHQPHPHPHPGEMSHQTHVTHEGE